MNKLETNKNAFFPMLSKMKYINRWQLMRNTATESLASHSFEVSVISHALAIIGNEHFGKSYNPDKCGMLGLYHDFEEVLTGDLPTPVKYYSKDIKDAFKQIANVAKDKLLNMLSPELKPKFTDYLLPCHANRELLILVTGADKISALIKCIEEEKAGNNEFATAKNAQLSALSQMHCQEVDWFLSNVLEGYFLNIDQLTL